MITKKEDLYGTLIECKGRNKEILAKFKELGLNTDYENFPIATYLYVEYNGRTSMSTDMKYTTWGRRDYKEITIEDLLGKFKVGDHIKRDSWKIGPIPDVITSISGDVLYTEGGRTINTSLYTDVKIVNDNVMKKFEVDEQFIRDAHKVACKEWKTKLEEKFPEAFPKTYKLGDRVKTDISEYMIAGLPNRGIVLINISNGEHFSKPVMVQDTDRITLDELTEAAGGAYWIKQFNL